MKRSTENLCFYFTQYWEVGSAIGYLSIYFYGTLETALKTVSIFNNPATATHQNSEPNKSSQAFNPKNVSQKRSKNLPIYRFEQKIRGNIDTSRTIAEKNRSQYRYSITAISNTSFVISYPSPPYPSDIITDFGLPKE